MDFDRELLDIIEPAVRHYVDRVRRTFHNWIGEDDARLHQNLRADGLLSTLDSVRGNRSLSRAYTEVNNQALVLLVSYFASSMRKMVRSILVNRIVSRDPGDLRTEELKFTVEELASDEVSLPHLVADRLLAAKGVSFQDMKSVARTLRRFVGYEPPRDQSVDDIIAGQAVRHAIVHAGATVDERLVNQLQAAPHRSICLDPELGAIISIGRDEVQVVSAAMDVYLQGACSAVASGTA